MKKALIVIFVLVIVLILSFFLLVKKDPGFAPGWETYANETYGYQISYPSDIVKINTAANTLDRELTELQKTDPFVVLMDKNKDVDKISTIVISAVFESEGEIIKVGTVDELKTFYQEKIIPQFFGEAGDGLQALSEADFVFQEIEFAGKRAFIVKSPIETSILFVNSKNDGMALVFPEIDHSESESPDKSKNTESVLNTFKLTK